MPGGHLGSAFGKVIVAQQVRPQLLRRVGCNVILHKGDVGVWRREELPDKGAIHEHPRARLDPFQVVAVGRRRCAVPSPLIE